MLHDKACNYVPGRSQPTRLGLFVARRRQQLGLTQEELAERMSDDQFYISQVERGVIKRPRDAKMAAFAEALEVTRTELYQAAGIIEAPSDALAAPSNDQPAWVTFFAVNSHKITPEVRDALLAIAKADIDKQSQ